MKNKLTGKQIRLLLCLIIVAIIALSYEYIYVKYEDLAEEYAVKADTTQQLIAQREDDLAKEDDLEQQTKDITGQYEKIINIYPVNITKEDNLIFIEQLEKDLKLDIPSVNILDNTGFYTTILPVRDENGNEIITSGQESDQASSAEDASQTAIQDTNQTQSNTVQDTEINESGIDTSSSADTATGIQGTDASSSADTSTGIQGADTSGTTNTTDGVSTSDSTDSAGDTSGQQYMTSLKSSIDISFQTSYKGFKKLVDYINKLPEKTSISNVSLSYDGSAGELLCSMTINRYALAGTGKVYEEPYIGDISIGTDNIFGTTHQKN